MARPLPFRRTGGIAMAARLPSRRTSGFSMVEMLVALVFTMVLMAGMAAVFKASLSTFFTSGEALGNVRRNRLSIDLLGQDLDTACMYLEDMNVAPTFSTTCPGFYILPNMAITGLPSSPAAGDPTSADQLYFYLDQPLPFEGSLVAGATTPKSESQLVLNGAAATTTDQTFTVECNTPSYAGMVANGQHFIFKDAFEVGTVAAAPTVSGSQVTVQIGASATSGVTGTGSTGNTASSHLLGAGVLFYQPAQMVRYMVQYLKLDPNSGDGNLIPCLVRDQGSYSTSGFTATQTQQIITENVSGFKVYLSARPDLVATNDAGAWAGLGNTTATDLAGWNATLLGTTSTPDPASITMQLAAAFPTATAPANDPNWFRSNPILVRVDLTTRSASQRTEFISANNASATSGSAYKLLTQSLIFVPRHSGLPMASF